MSRPRYRSSDPYVVSDRTCSGCVYYGPLHTGAAHSIKCCDYTYVTGRARPYGETCAQCTVRQTGERAKSKVQININHGEDGVRQYRERMGIVPKRRAESLNPEDVQFLADLLDKPPESR